MIEEEKEIHNDLLKNKRDIDPLLEGLVFLSSYYQRSTSKEVLISGLPMYNRSMSVANFIEASKKIGLISKVVERELTDISRLAMPVVLILKDHRSCILLDFNKQEKTAKVILPGLSEGEIDMPIDQLQEEFIGQVIIVKPEYKFENKISKEIQLGDPRDWFWAPLKKNIPIYKKAILAAFFINLFVLAIPLFMKNVFDRVLPNNAIETLLAMSIGLFFVLIFDLIFSLFRAYYLGKAGKSVDLIMSNKIFSHILNIKLDYKPSSTGQFVSRLQSFNAVREFFTSATMATLVDIPFALIFLIIIFYFAGELALVSLITVIIVISISLFMQKRIKDVIEKSVKEEQLKQTTLNETIAGLEIIKSTRAQNRMRTYWDDALNKTLLYGEQAQFLLQMTTQLTSMVIKASSVAVIIVGVYLSLEGSLSMGGIIVAMMLNTRVIAPINQVVGMIIRYDQMMLAFKNIDEIMDMPVERENKTYLSRPNLRGDIEFKDVTFAYQGQNIDILKNINLTIKQGEKVAILGKVGSGKSTIAKLIMGLYTPKSGSILIDKTDIRQVDPTDLRNTIGYVPQEPFLFMGSVKDNIVVGEQFATDEEILEASKAAGVHEFVGRHDEGYDLLVGERGEGLSGGERQAITLARALITKPNILILDEPTNSMDRQTEHAFLKHMKSSLQDETLIIITHKVTTLSLVDRIIVIDNGTIVTDGPKSIVMKQKEA